MKTLLFIGGSGGIGKELVPKLMETYIVEAPTSSELNLRDNNIVKEYFLTVNPDIIVHSAVRNYDNLLHKTDPITVEIQVDNNVLGLINLLRWSIPKMREKQYGRIIYLSSILSKQPIRGTGVYAACKAFNESIIRTSALENAKYGITCNNIRLGYMNVGIIKDVPTNVLEEVVKTIPLNRLGIVDEIFNTVQYLINTEYITGTNIDLNGGLYGN